jgi:hypothetical protein
MADEVTALEALIVETMADYLIAIVDAVVVEEALRHIIIDRVADRIHLVQWPRPWATAAAAARMGRVPTGASAALSGSLRDPEAELDAMAQAYRNTDRRELQAVWRLEVALIAIAAVESGGNDASPLSAMLRTDGFDLDRMLPFIITGTYGAAVSALTRFNNPSAARSANLADVAADIDDEVGAIADRSTGPFMWGVDPNGTDATTVRLVAWFVVVETKPQALAGHAARSTPGVDNPDAIRELTRATEDALGRWSRTPAAVVPDGVHPLDEALALTVSTSGARGRTLAEEIRDVSRRLDDDGKAKRWEHEGGRFRVARALALCLWEDVVKARLERAATAAGAPGLAVPVLTNLVRVSRNGAQATMFDSGRAEILDHRGRRVGSLQLTTPAIGAEHIDLANLGKLSTMRLVRFLLHRTYEQRWIQQHPDANTVEIDGGFPGLAAALGMKGHKAAEELRAAVATLDAVHIDTPTGEGRVFSYFHHKATGQRSARLDLTVQGPFAPDYITRALAGHRGEARNKYLVPIPMPQRLPPLVGRERDHAAQAFLQVLVLRELRVRAEELAERGSVEIDQRLWEALRDEAGLPAATLPKVLDAYPVGDGERPAFLLSPTPGRYTLADAYEQEQRSILEAAAAMTKGRKGGKAAAARRRNGGRQGK